jgi:tRNA pseudouridine38-40 synthase
MDLYGLIDKSYNDKIMNMAAQHFIGTHDFTGFCSQKTEVESKIRTLYESRIEKTESGFDYIVTGSGFLYNMVRVLIAFPSAGAVKGT